MLYDRTPKLDRGDINPEASVVLAMGGARVDLSLDPVNGIAVSADVWGVRVVESSLAVAVSSEPAVVAPLLLRSLRHLNVPVQVAVKRCSCIPVRGSVLGVLRDGLTDHEPVLLEDAKVSGIAR